ncbi:MAG: DNA polymerase III subunit chi, partial [Alphaproteobacteria bacterium]|nr:DNA polymerase III subunit chi [Alphaproteobacteria bacterium]
MTRIDFYHLQKTSLEQVLPKLAEKAYATKKRIKILVGTEERVEFINSLLWTYSEESFLPHGSKKDGFVEDQPIFISASEENENGAALLILVDGAEPEVSKL